MKLIRSATLSLFVLMAACTSEFQGNLKEYVDTALPRIMAQQEQKLGIKYSGAPQIAVFSGPAGASSAVADYDSESGTMKVYSRRNFSEKGVNRSLSHELGHYYSDSLLKLRGFQKELNSDSTLNIQDLRNRREILRKSMIAEGIAEYFSRNTLDFLRDCRNISLGYNDYTDRFKDRGVESGEFVTNAFLNNSYCLVAPILETDIDQGIEYLATHPPNENQLEKLRSYQEQAKKEFTVLAR